MSHPRQDSNRRLGRNDEPEVAEERGTASHPGTKGTEDRSDEGRTARDVGVARGKGPAATRKGEDS